MHKNNYYQIVDNRKTSLKWINLLWYLHKKNYMTVKIKTGAFIDQHRCISQA